MALTLRVENETSMPDGGPLSITIQGKRGIDIGRDSHLDWTLPDPTRFISGKHCEIRYKDGGYWLYDVSTNGTYLNGAEHRIQAPHRLSNGDRFVIGNYIVAATVEEEDGSANAPSQNATTPVMAPLAGDQELWEDEGAIAPPIDSKQLKMVETKQPLHSDFLDWAVDIPNPDRGSAPSPVRARSIEPSADPDAAWATGLPSDALPAAPASIPIPTPRRQVRDRTAETPRQEGSASTETSASFAERTPAEKMPSATPASPVLTPLTGDGSSDFLRQLAKSAGLSEDFFKQTDSAELARQFGEILGLVVENLMQLLSARAHTKRLARSPTHTVIQATDNNPLKFAPSAQEALRIMFAPTTQSYLGAQRAIEQSFDDLKRHQIKTYSAMQHAVSMLMADLGPQAIERNTADVGGLARLLSSRNAKLWEAYVARWNAKVRQGEIGPIETFMLYFGEYYDSDGG